VTLGGEEEQTGLNRDFQDVQIIRKKYSSGNYYEKFGHFPAKNHVKFRNFVNFRANIIKMWVGYFDNFRARM